MIKQQKHSFHLHTEYIHYDDINDTDDVEILNEEELKQWIEDERNGLNDLDQKPESEVHPFLSTLDDLIKQIEKSYPRITWKSITDSQTDDFEISVYLGSIYSANGLLEFTICAENQKVFNPLRIDVSLTDYPYIEVRALSKWNKWFIYHLNSFQYLDVDDDSETGKDFISALA